MLVITRRPQQKVIIGHDIEITVLGIRSGQVKLGIHAPKEVPVNRQEVHWRGVTKAALLAEKVRRLKELGL